MKISLSEWDYFLFIYGTTFSTQVLCPLCQMLCDAVLGKVIFTSNALQYCITPYKVSNYIT